MIPRAMLAVAYATGRTSRARQVTGDDPDKTGYPGPPGWGLVVRLTNPPRKQNIFTKPQKKKTRRPRPTQGCRADDDDDDDDDLINGTIFGKNSLNLKRVLFFSTNVVGKVSHYKRNLARYYHKCSLVFM
jgi:hypothetical protein